MCDLVLRGLLSWRKALSSYGRRKNTAKFSEPENAPPGESPPQIYSESTYFIGDTHFDHKNGIREFRRPFTNVTEMNKVMKDNWNSTVGDNDTVYFLGDWTMGWGHRPAKYWIGQLKGIKFSLRGNHDKRERDIRYEDFKELHIKGYDFLVIHNPDPDDPRQTREQKQKLQNWQGWVIHGHTHADNMGRYPFINGERRTINVSVEVIHYRPVSLSSLLALNLDSIKRMQTVDSDPERW